MTVTPPTAAQPSRPAAPQKTSALAVGALILGICGIVPFLGWVLGGAGIVLGIVALAKHAGGKGFAVGGIIAGIVGIVVGQVLAFALLLVPRVREGREGLQCGSNLHAIGEGMAMYWAENQNAYPPDLDVLVRQGKVQREALRCPSVEHGRRCDYFYLAPSGGAADVPDDLLVACDLRGNHGQRRNVMYAHASVGGRTEAEFQPELAKPINAAFAAALKEAEGE